MADDLVFASQLFFQKKQSNFLPRFFTLCPFITWGFSLSRFSRLLQRELILLLSMCWGKKNLHLAGERFKHVENRKILSARRPKTMKISTRPADETSKECSNNCSVAQSIFCSWRNVSHQKTEGNGVNSRYVSTGSNPIPNCALRVLTCIFSPGDFKRTMWVF